MSEAGTSMSESTSPDSETELEDPSPPETDAAEGGQAPDNPPSAPFPFDAAEIRTAAAIFALAILSFLPALRAAYLWDDSGITENALLRSGEGLLEIWFNPAAQAAERHYWPLVYTSFWIENFLFGLSPIVSHLINLLLHAANAVLVWRVARKLGLPGAAIAGLLFAAHPAHAESIAWAIERKDLLSAFFYLLAFASYLRFEESRKSSAFVGAIACFAAALLCKSIALSFPVAVALALWARPSQATRERLALLVPLGLAAAAFAAIDLAVVGSFGPPSAPELTLGDRLLVPARALFFYVEKLAWPGHQMPIYPRWDLEEPGTLAFYYPILLAAAFAGLWAARGAWGRAPIALAVFYFVTLAPALGFLRHDFMRLSFVADRHQYLASAGLLGLAAAAASVTLGRLARAPRRAGFAALGAGIAALAAVSWTQTLPYESPERFWTRAAALNPRSAEVAVNFGFALMKEGRPEEAATQFEKAIALDPSLGLAQIALAGAYTELKRYDEAMRLCEEALKRSPNSQTAMMAMGNLLSAQGREDEAVKYFEKALAGKPESPTLRINMGYSLTEQGDLDGAIEEFNRVLAVQPGNVKALFGLARAAQLRGDLGMAMDNYLRALQIQPTYVEALVNSGAILAQMGRGPEALSQLQRALELEPSNAKAHMNLGAVLGGAGDSAKAIAEYQKALELQPDYPDALNNLGIEFGIIGDAAKAEECFQKIIATHPDHAQSRNSLGILRAQQGRLEEAAKLFEEAAKLDPRSQEFAANVQRIRSQMEMMKNASPTPAP